MSRPGKAILKGENRMKYALAICAAVTVLVGAGKAKAGYHWLAGDYVQRNADGSGYAGGEMIGTRASSDNNAWVGCNLFHYSYSGATLQGYCYVTDANNVTLGCTTSDPQFLPIIAAINSQSYISFDVNAAGICTSLSIETSSAYTY
jgi:hypothetical protein